VKKVLKQEKRKKRERKKEKDRLMYVLALDAKIEYRLG
jgi:hypothetical protein